MLDSSRQSRLIQENEKHNPVVIANFLSSSSFFFFLKEHWLNLHVNVLVMERLLLSLWKQFKVFCGSGGALKSEKDSRDSQVGSRLELKEKALTETLLN